MRRTTTFLACSASAALLWALAGAHATFAAGEKRATATQSGARAATSGLQRYKYRFTVPYDLSRVPSGVREAGVTCTVCRELDTSRSRCQGGRSGSTPIPLHLGAASGQVQVEVHEHPMQQIGPNAGAPVTEGLHYSCHLTFNGEIVSSDTPDGLPTARWQPAEGSTPVVVATGSIPD
jgi:hypothetical protein